MAGVIIIKSGQKATYVVDKDFNYYIQMEAGSTVIFKSKSKNGIINLNKKIWGLGNIIIDCTVNLKADIGMPPSQSEIRGLLFYEYTVTEFIEEIEQSMVNMSIIKVQNHDE